jgi:PCO_ADO
MERFDRRYILRTSLLSFAYLCGVAPKLVARSRAADRTLEWNAFTNQLESAAREFYLKQTTSEFHVRTVEQLLRRLNLTTPRLADIPVEESNGTYPYPEFQDLMRSTDVQVSLLSFSAGEQIPYHNHPSMTGVMTCVRGKLEVDSYNYVGRLSEEEWVIRALPRALLRPGDTSTLTEKARNIHRVAAPTAAQIIDIFAPPYDANRTISTRWFKLRSSRAHGADPCLFIAETQ